MHPGPRGWGTVGVCRLAASRSALGIRRLWRKNWRATSAKLAPMDCQRSARGWRPNSSAWSAQFPDLSIRRDHSSDRLVAHDPCPPAAAPGRTSGTPTRPLRDGGYSIPVGSVQASVGGQSTSASGSSFQGLRVRKGFTKERVSRFVSHKWFTQARIQPRAPSRAGLWW